MTRLRGAASLFGPARVTALTVLTAAAAVLLTATTAVRQDSLLGLGLLTLAIAVTELRPVHVGRNGQRQSFTLSEGPLVMALAMAPGRYVVLAVAAGVLIAQVRRGVPPYKTFFNVSQFAASAALATRCAELIPGQLGVVAALVLFTCANEALVRVVLWVATGKPAMTALHSPGRVWLLHVTATTSIALLAAHMLEGDASMLPAFAAPALLVMWSQEQSGRRRAQALVQRAVAEQATALYGRASEETGALLTRTTRGVLAAGKVELIVLGGGRLVRTTDDHGHVERGTLRPEMLATGWRADVLAATGSTGNGTWAGAVIADGDRPVALLSVWRDEGSEPFHAPDLELLDSLVGTAAGWLREQTPAVGFDVDPSTDVRRYTLGLGAGAEHVASALSTLRDVRARLEDLPAGSAGEVQHAGLADELRAAETSLAAFVGTLVTPRQRTSDEEAEAQMVLTGRWAGPGE